MAKFISFNNLADVMGVSIATARKWSESGMYPKHKDEHGNDGFWMEELKMFARITGHDDIHALSLDDLCTVSRDLTKYAGIPHA